MSEILDGRRVGNTTRHIDEMVQELFTKGETYLWDHAHRVDKRGNALNFALNYARRIFFDRLRHEHSLEVNKGFYYDPKTQRVALKNIPYDNSVLQQYIK